MLPVETYLTVEPKDLQKALSTHSFLSFQGQNLIFIQGKYSTNESLSFVEKVFPFIGKIAVLDKDGEYHLVSDKFGVEAIEPFVSYKDERNTFVNSISRISTFISFGHKKYEV